MQPENLVLQESQGPLVPPVCQERKADQVKLERKGHQDPWDPQARKGQSDLQVYQASPENAVFPAFPVPQVSRVRWVPQAPPAPQETKAPQGLLEMQVHKAPQARMDPQVLADHQERRENGETQECPDPPGETDSWGHEDYPVPLDLWESLARMATRARPDHLARRASRAARAFRVPQVQQGHRVSEAPQEPLVLQASVALQEEWVELVGKARMGLRVCPDLLALQEYKACQAHQGQRVKRVT